MALPAKGTLGQIVAYNGYNYKWNGVGWINVGAASTTTGNTVTGNGTSVSANGVATGNSTTNTAISANGVSTGNSTTNTAVSANGVSTGNSTVNTAVSANGVSTGNSTTNTAVSANGVSTGNSTANTSVSANGVATGNATHNTAVTANGVSTGNTTTKTQLTANGVSTGNSTTNTSVSANGVSTGNATHNTAITSNGVSTGNTTTKTQLTSNGVSTGNSVANISINSTAVSIGAATINSSFFTGTANNALNLGGISATNYITKNGNQTIGGIYTYTNILNANVANFAGDVVISNNLTVTGSLTFTGVSSIIDTQDVSVSNSVINLHSPAELEPLDFDDGRLLGLAIHYYDYSDKQAFLALNQSNAFLTYYRTSTDTKYGEPAGIDLGTIQAGEFHVGNNIVFSKINSSSFSGTANNALYIGGLLAANVATTAQTELLASKTSVVANAAAAYTNAVSYIDAAISQVGGGGDTAYANMIAYIENQYFVNTAQLSSNIGNFSVTQEYVAEFAFNAAGVAYSNTIDWISQQPFVYIPDLVNYASIQLVDTAYANAVAQTAVYVNNLSLVNSSQLAANLAPLPNSAYVIDTAGIAADRAYANAVTYIQNQAGLATAEAIVANSETAYTNAISYIVGLGYIDFSNLNLILENYPSFTYLNDQQYINTTSINSYSFVNTSQLAANLASVPNSAYVIDTAGIAADRAYANAITYIENQTSIATTEAIIANADAAYANAVNYVEGQGYINFAELNLILDNYANVSSVTNAAHAAENAYSNSIAYTDSVVVTLPNSAYVVDTAKIAADQAYANAVTYIENQTAIATTEAIIANAEAAYANAISYVSSQGYVGYNNLNLILNDYANLNLVEQVRTLALNSYSNSISYTDSLFQTVPSMEYVIATAGIAADRAYANTILYIDAQTGGVTAESIIANAAAAFTNAVSFVNEQGYVTGGQLSANLADYSTTAQTNDYIASLHYSNTVEIASSILSYNYVNTSLLETTLVDYTTTQYISSLFNTSLPIIVDTAYTNAVIYVDNQSFVNTDQLSTALANYATDSVTPAAGIAYTNAVAYVNSKSYVNTSQLAANLASLTNTSNNYTFTGVHTYNANLVINRTVIINGNAGLPGQVLTSNGSGNTIYWSTPSSSESSSGGIFDGGTPFSVFTNGPRLDAGGVI